MSITLRIRTSQSLQLPPLSSHSKNKASGDFAPSRIIILYHPRKRTGCMQLCPPFLPRGKGRGKGEKGKGKDRVLMHVIPILHEPKLISYKFSMIIFVFFLRRKEHGSGESGGLLTRWNG